MLKLALLKNVRVLHGVVLLLAAALLSATLHGVCPLLFQGQAQAAADCVADISTSESDQPNHHVPADCVKQPCFTLPAEEDYALAHERPEGSAAVVWVFWLLSSIFPILPLVLGSHPPNIPPPHGTTRLIYRFCSLLN